MNKQEALAAFVKAYSVPSANEQLYHCLEVHGGLVIACGSSSVLLWGVKESSEDGSVDGFKFEELESISVM